METHSGNLAWEIPRTEDPGGLQPMGVTKSRTGLSTALLQIKYSKAQQKVKRYSSLSMMRA